MNKLSFIIKAVLLFSCGSLHAWELSAPNCEDIRAKIRKDFISGAINLWPNEVLSMEALAGWSSPDDIMLKLFSDSFAFIAGADVVLVEDMYRKYFSYNRNIMWMGYSDGSLMIYRERHVEIPGGADLHSDVAATVSAYFMCEGSGSDPLTQTYNFCGEISYDASGASFLRPEGKLRGVVESQIRYPEVVFMNNGDFPNYFLALSLNSESSDIVFDVWTIIRPIFYEGLIQGNNSYPPSYEGPEPGPYYLATCE